MAVLARATITLAQTIDIESVTWYYRLQASTASAPAKPTTEVPSGWSTSEPSYTEGSTNSLYVVEKTTYSNGTFEYSEVSLSSSYEAAKQAYNKSVAAEEQAKEAEKVATKYVTDQTDGIFVHPEGEGPNDTNTPTGWRIRDALEMLKSGVSLFKAWVENNVTKVRVGRDDKAHFLIQDGKIAGYGSASSIYFETGDGGNTVQQTYSGDGSTQYFDVLQATSLTSITVNGTTVSATLQNSSLVKLTSIPSDGATVVITYKTSVSAPYFTFGTRGSGTVGIGSSAFGNMNKAPGIYAMAEGEGSTASGFAAHAEGSENIAFGSHSHAEGRECSAIGDDSHAGGNLSVANGQYSFAHGQNTKTTVKGSMACGRYNFPHAILFGVGNGTANSDSSRKNAFSVGETGNCFVGGRLLSGTPSSSGSDYRAMFHVADKTFSSLSVPAENKMSAMQKKSVAVTGYTPVAVCCYGMSGTNGLKCFPFAIAFAGNDILFNIYNTGTSAATASIRFTILYIASAAL